MFEHDDRLCVTTNCFSGLRHVPYLRSRKKNSKTLKLDESCVYLLTGRVGRTFQVQSSRKDLVEFDPDSLSFGEDLNEDNVRRPSSEDEPEFTYNEIKDAHWFYDTPGIMKERDVSTITQCYLS